MAWEGREKLPTSRIFEEYRGKRALTPTDRKKRLKPLNDLFSMAECCLIADTIQFFKDRDIPYCAQNVVTDVLNSVTATHLSGDFHRLVAENPQRYFDPTPHLKDVLRKLKESGKRLIFVSNSPFWYVDAGMRYVFGGSWRKEWDAIITSKFGHYDNCCCASMVAIPAVAHQKPLISNTIQSQVPANRTFTRTIHGPFVKCAKRRDDSTLIAWKSLNRVKSIPKVA